MKKQRYNVSDLLQQIHQQGIDDIREISFAILENNGNLSVIKQSDSKLLFPYPIINDGKIDNEVINKICTFNIDIPALLENINNSIEDIFIAFIDTKHKLIIFPKKSNK
jgi:uncharacterized membrane protein YcaP (DUF421 family)